MPRRRSRHRVRRPQRPKEVVAGTPTKAQLKSWRKQMGWGEITDAQTGQRFVVKRINPRQRLFEIVPE